MLDITRTVNPKAFIDAELDSFALLRKLTENSSSDAFKHVPD